VKRCLACGESFAGERWQCTACAYEPVLHDRVRLFAPTEASFAEGFDETSFGHLPSVEDRSFWFRARNRLVVWALHKYFPEANSMFEVGCGTGYVLRGVARAFPALRLVGGELLPAGLAVAARRAPRAELLQIDARHLPYTGEFDVVGAFDVLEHIEEDEQVLREVQRTLRPGGGLLVTVPQHPRLWSPVDQYARHVRRYRRAELLDKMRSAGFEILRATSFVSLLVPILAASRIRQRGCRDCDPLAEYRSSAFVDSALAWVMATERSMIRAGLSLPAGGSLLAVGRRR
jgi:SAM-dependent methyltransferase